VLGFILAIKVSKIVLFAFLGKYSILASPHRKTYIMSQSSTESKTVAAARQARTLPVATEIEWRGINLRVPDGLYRRFKIYCVEHRIKIQDVSIEIIEKFLAAGESRAA
jgi:hypothetical protein